MYLSPLFPPSTLVEAIIALAWFRAICSLLASWCRPTVYFQQGSQNILLKQKSDSSYPSSSQNLADFSFTPSEARGLAFAPEAWHELGVLPSLLCLTTHSSPLSRRYSHAGPLSVSQTSQSTLSAIRVFVLTILSIQNAAPCTACSFSSFRIKCHFLMEAFPNRTI